MILRPRRISLGLGNSLFVFRSSVPLTPHQQFKELLAQAKRPLVALPKDPSIDAIVSALAVARLCKKLNKPFDVIGAQFTSPMQLSFLPAIADIKGSVSNLRRFLITVDTERTKVADFSYTVADKQLEIYLTPVEGVWQSEDVQLRQGGWLNDLCIVLDSRELESLGPLFDEHAEFFYQVPIINIDHHPDNENFGQTNIIQVKASSVAEILAEVVTAWNPDYLDADMATYLLTGVINKTQSFKIGTTPQTLHTASRLIELGGDRVTVVRHLYQQKSLATLRLWGRVLARIQNDPDTKLVWSLMPATDFEKSGGTPADLPHIIDELIANSPQAGIVVILYEDENAQIHGFARLLQNHYNLIEILQMYGPSGSAQGITFTLPDGTTLQASEDLVVKRIKEFIKK